MKKTLITALLLLPLLGISQTKVPIDGFLGIKFGSSKQAVIAAIKAKGGVFVKDIPGNKGSVFAKVKSGSREAAAFVVKFVDDKAYCAMFSFEPAEQPKSLDYYNSLVADITEKYGKGKSEAVFKEPFKMGDGYEITAIQGGYVNMFTDWDSDDHSIQVSVDHDGDDISITLTYTDDKLELIAEARNKAKQKSDL